MKLPRWIANRYARALADLTESRKESMEVMDELKEFAGLFAQDTNAFQRKVIPGRC